MATMKQIEADNYELHDGEETLKSTSTDVGATRDQQDMQRLGKRQLFDRNFRFLSITAFSLISENGWVFIPNNATSALIDGGSGGTIVMYIINFFCFSTIILSLAEMASMSPTAGGQYHWASEFAPPSLQKPLSYVAGWLSCLAWCCGTSSGFFMTGTLLQGVIAILHDNYTSYAWRSFLSTLAAIALTAFVNSYLARKLPLLEGIFFILVVAAYVSQVIVLWVLSEGNRPSASEVFQTFSNDGGWSSLGLAMVVGQVLLVWTLTGSDSTVHMAEETRNASTVIPRAMIWSYFINGLSNLLMLVTYIFCHKNLVDVPLGASGFQFISAFADVTGSQQGAAALVCVLIVLNIFSSLNFAAACARQIFAFARDHGLPLNTFLSRVDQRTNVPLYALGATLAFGVLVSLISLGSSVAFNAIVSVQLLALVFTYETTIGCLIWRRFFGEQLPYSTWSLGKLGLPINITAIVYSIYLTVFIAFPTTTPVTLETFNWSPVIFGGVVLLASGYYIASARKKYEGPAVYIRRASKS